MSAEAVGRHMSAIITLDDLAAMISADTHGRRYETSPEGVLSVVPPSDSEHAVIATRLMLWLGLAGWPAEQMMQGAGIRISGRDGDGGRIPDLTIWSRPQQHAVWLATTDLLLVIEIISRGSDCDVSETRWRPSGQSPACRRCGSIHGRKDAAAGQWRS